MAGSLVIGASGIVFWFLLFRFGLWWTRPSPVRADPPTQELPGNESPAIVSFLANGWQLTDDAAAATLLDLAARRYLELRQPGDDPAQTTVHVRDRQPKGLRPHERRLFDRVAAAAGTDGCPLIALAFRDKKSAEKFAGLLHADLAGQTRRLGLSERRFPFEGRATLLAATVVPAATITAAVLRGAQGNTVGMFLAVELVLLVLAMYLVLGSQGERDTPLGQMVAGRWFGLKAYLRDYQVFRNQPPASVAIWDRYLAYAVALGEAPVASSVIGVGMSERKWIWSTYGGVGRQVRVRYPRFWPRYGHHIQSFYWHPLLAFGIAFPLMRYGDWFTRDVPLPPNIAAALVLVAAWLLVAFGVYVLVCVLIALVSTVTVTGEVLWVAGWRKTNGSETFPSVWWLHYLVVDDGRSERTVAWGCPSEEAELLAPGDVVTFTARRWTRRMENLCIDRAGARPEPAAMAIESPVEPLLARRSRPDVPKRRSRPDKLTPARLMTDEEVSRALGRPVTSTRSADEVHGGAMAESYVDAAGVQVFYAEVATGRTGLVRLPTHQPLPGIGDEAYAGPGWAVAKRDGHVMTFNLRGPALGVPTANLAWLLHLAVGRMPHGLPVPPHE